jgi:hypothetical protein
VATPVVPPGSATVPDAPSGATLTAGDVTPEATPPAGTHARGTDGPAAGVATPGPGGPGPADVLLPETVWNGVFIDSTGRTAECIFAVERRTNDRVTLVAYFPAEGLTALRWAATLGAGDMLVEGAGVDRQRLSLRARLAAGRLTGTWESVNGRRGTFTFAPNTARAESFVASSMWAGQLHVANGSTLDLTLRLSSRQEERFNGFCMVAGQRHQLGCTGILLGDRVLGTINGLPLAGSQRVQVRFSATVRSGVITGTWTTETGLSGKLEWRREP